MAKRGEAFTIIVNVFSFVGFRLEVGTFGNDVVS